MTPDPFLVSLRRLALLLTLVLLPVILALAGTRGALSFIIGAALGYLNFALLEQGVSRALALGEGKGSSAAIWRFLLRTVLYTAVLYAMIAGRYLHIVSAMVGLSLFVIAIMLKGFHAALTGIRPGSRETFPVPSGSETEH